MYKAIIYLTLIAASSAQFLPNGCPSNGGVHLLLPHETDCAKYYSCSNGNKIEMNCAPGTLFDANLQVCNWPFAVQCTTPSPQQTTTTPVPTTTTTPLSTTPATTTTTGPTVLLPNGCPADFSVPSLLPHPTDCSKYYQCSNGNPVEMTCGDGTLFDYELQLCGWPFMVQCNVTTTTPLPTTTTTEEPTTTTTDEPTTTTTESPTTTTTEEPTTSTTTGVPPSDRCPEGMWGNVPHEYRCDSFYMCAAGNAIPLYCSDGFEFDPVTRACVLIAEGGCTYNSTTTTPEPTTLDPTSALCPPGTWGNVPHPEICNSFYMCAGTPIQLFCSEGFEFDPKTRQCVAIAEGGCTYNQSTTTEPPTTTTTEEPTTSTTTEEPTTTTTEPPTTSTTEEPTTSTTTEEPTTTTIEPPTTSTTEEPTTSTTTEEPTTTTTEPPTTSTTEEPTTSTTTEEPTTTTTEPPTTTTTEEPTTSTTTEEPTTTTIEPPTTSTTEEPTTSTTTEEPTTTTTEPPTTSTTEEPTTSTTTEEPTTTTTEPPTTTTTEEPTTSTTTEEPTTTTTEPPTTTTTEEPTTSTTTEEPTTTTTEPPTTTTTEEPTTSTTTEEPTTTTTEPPTTTTTEEPTTSTTTEEPTTTTTEPPTTSTTEEPTTSTTTEEPTTTTTEPPTTSTTEEPTTSTTTEEPTTTTIEPPTTSTIEESTTSTTTGVPPPDRCPEGVWGNIPHEYRCDSFYMCAAGNAIPLYCSDGFEFDPVTRQCVAIAEGGCTYNSTTTTPEPTTLDPTSALCPPGTLGNVPHPEICNSFYMCAGTPIQLFCSEGFEFDPKTRQCVEIAEGGCTYNQGTTTELPTPTTTGPHLRTLPAGQLGQRPPPGDLQFIILP